MGFESIHNNYTFFCCTQKWLSLKDYSTFCGLVECAVCSNGKWGHFSNRTIPIWALLTSWYRYEIEPTFKNQLDKVGKSKKTDFRLCPKKRSHLNSNHALATTAKSRVNKKVPRFSDKWVQKL